jgi:hypothetical protein
MSSVDNRIVNMTFNNAAFEAGAAQTMATLDRLQQKLGFQGASAGLQAIEAQAGKFDLSHMGAAVDQIAARFTTLGVIAVTALATITNKAIEAGVQLTKSLTIGPIGEGFSDYNLKLTSIKTVMNTTGKSLEVVNGYFEELDEYADKTIFKLSDMTSAFAKFTNSGISMKKAVPAIKGVSNMVALAGQGADAASIAYYNLSQSISGGFLTTTDYKSLNLANVATKEWKQNIIDAAVEAGTLRKDGKDMYTTLSGESEKAFKSADLFNLGLSEQWANADILLDVLGDYGDATTEIGKKAQGAAQDVKSLPMMLDTLKAAVGTSWTDTFEILFGNVEQSTKLFTNLTNTIGGVLDKSNDARNKLLEDWAKLGGRADVIEGIKNIFAALGDVLGPIKEAFREFFPAKTGQDLADASERFKEFTENLRLGDETMENLKRTFRGVFAVFDIIGMVLGGAIGVVKDLFGTVGEGSGSFLEVTAAIGDWLVSLRDAIEAGEGLNTFFDGLTAVLRVPIRLIQALAGFIADLFTGVDGQGADNMSDSLTTLSDILEPLGALGERVSDIFKTFGETFRNIADFIEPLADFMSNAIQSIGDALADAFSGDSFDKTLDAINTGLFAALVLLFKKFINGGLGGLVGGGKGGILDSILAPFKQLTSVLQSMQQNLKANILLKIAGAVALLAASIVVLSMIDGDKLVKAMTAIAVGFGFLVGAMLLLEHASTIMGTVKMPLIASSMLVLSGAMVLLAAAVKIFSTMDPDEMSNALLGMAGALFIIAKAMRAMPLNLPVTAAGLVLVGVGLAAIAGAMKLFATFDWDEIGRGLTAMAGALGAVALGMNLMPLSLPITAAGLILVGIGLTGVAGAMKAMANLSWKEMGRGLVGVAGALIIIAGAMNLMPLTLPLTAAGLVIVSGALVILAGALKLMGSMSWEEIGKGLTALGGSLLILAVGLNVMSGTLLGAAALVVAAGALAILTPILVTLGQLSWEEIAKGLAALAGALTILGLAGLLLTPVVPTLLGLGAALALVGAGMALAGAGALAFAAAFAIITATGAAGVAVLGAMLNVIIDAIPAALAAFGEGIIAFVEVIAKGGPRLVKAFVQILSDMLDGVIQITPKIGRAITVLIHTFLQIIRQNFPDIVETGFQMLMSLLRGIRKNIGDIVDVVSDIIIRFMRALRKNLPDLLDEGAKLIIAFIEGLADTVSENDDQLIDAGYDLAGAIITGLLKGLAEGPIRIANAAWNLGKSAINSMMDAVDAHSPSREAMKVGKYVVDGFIKGLDGGEQEVLDSFARMKDLITAQFDATKADIENKEAKLDELREHPSKNAEEIQKLEAALKRSESLHKKAADARKVFNKDLKDEQKELRGLAKEHDRLTTELEEAQRRLEEATRERDDFAKSTADRFGALPDIEEQQGEKAGTTLNQFAESLTAQDAANERFLESLNQLKAMGLDDAAYQKLLDEGVGIQPFIDELIANGPLAVEEIDRLIGEVTASAGAIGAAATAELKQDGVNMAQGLVDGLESEIDTLEKAMRKVARKMIRALKKELGIKSPSREMMEIGRFSDEGLANGLEKYAYKVDASAANVANAAIESMKSTLQGMAAAVATEVNATPTITPVLDLTQVTKDAETMSTMMDKAAVAEASYGAAASISEATLARLQAAAAETEAPRSDVKVELTQINQSPKALSEVDIYRSTKNLVALAEEALSDAANQTAT